MFECPHKDSTLAMQLVVLQNMTCNKGADVPIRHVTSRDAPTCKPSGEIAGSTVGSAVRFLIRAQRLKIFLKNVC